MTEIHRIHVIWLPGQACTGCTVSLLNASHPSILDLLTGFIPPAAGVTLDYHATIMLPWGEEAMAAVEAAEKGELAPFVLVLEGAIPDESMAEKSGGYWCVIGEDEHGKPVGRRGSSSQGGAVDHTTLGHKPHYVAVHPHACRPGFGGSGAASRSVPPPQGTAAGYGNGRQAA